MAGKRKDKEPTEATPSRYDDELLSANWNPVIALLDWSCNRTAAQTSRPEQSAIREEDADDFLGRIYTSGC